MESKKAKVIGLVKDLVTAGLIILIILTVMYAYTRVWPPMVVIESNSMEHTDAGYGRLGTIDAGDFTFVKKIDGREDIITYYQGKKTGYLTYGNYGDVIIFQKNGRPGTPIIHRAMLWVELNGTKYDIPELGPDYMGLDVINIEEEWLTLTNLKPLNSGFITKGDANPYPDQRPNSGTNPVKTDWILGVARGELPWFGGIKLLFDDLMHRGDPSYQPNAGNVRHDCWAMLGVAIALLLAVPASIDYSYPFIKNKIVAFREQRKLKKKMLEKLEKLEFRVEREKR